MSNINVERSGWAALAASAVALEAWTYFRQTDDRNNTLSNTTRTLFRTDTRLGRTVFHLCLGTASAWFSYHVGVAAGSISERVALRDLILRRKMIQSDHE